MKKHIIVCDHIHEEGLKILESQKDIIVENLASLPKDELLKHIHKADVLITRSSTAVNKKLLDSTLNKEATGDSNADKLQGLKAEASSDSSQNLGDLHSKILESKNTDSQDSKDYKNQDSKKHKDLESNGQDFKDSESKTSPKLKAIVRAGVGVDNIDIDSCSKLGVVIMNVPTANTIAAVELTMTHILSTIRRLPGANHQLKHERRWNREDWYGIELKGRRLGIIGFGNIGSRVGIRARAFEMDVITYDPYINPSKALDVGVKYTNDFGDILQCDIITIHTPKNKQTINMISKSEIEKMKDGVILINCARGGLYNESDLFDALKRGKVAFAGLDVFDKEPATDNKLLQLDNIYVTPHIGANTLESQEKISIQAAQAAICAARGVSFPNALNLPTKDMPEHISSYLELAQKLGYFAAQALSGAINSIKIQIRGDDLQGFADGILTFGVVGSLKPSLDDKVNYVNAHFVAKDRGIESSIVARRSGTTYKNLITLTLTSESESMSVSGTVYDSKIVRFNNINGFIMDLEPRGNMILFKNTDVPGVIGNVGNTIAKHNVNIADFRLGRSPGGSSSISSFDGGSVNLSNKNEKDSKDSKGSKKAALALILVDDNVTDSLLEDLRNIKECISARHVLM